MTWKALPTSRSRYAAQTHAPAVAGFGNTDARAQRRGRPRKNSKAEYAPEHVEDVTIPDDEPPEKIDLREILPA